MTQPTEINTPQSAQWRAPNTTQRSAVAHTHGAASMHQRAKRWAVATIALLGLAGLGMSSGQITAQTATQTGVSLKSAHSATASAEIVMASTTSTEQSGLFAHLLPAFQRATGVQVKVVALGTGQALDMGRRGDADVLFVHDTVAEEKLVADGFAVKRYPVMYNDFVLVGPAADPAKARGQDIASALQKVANTSAAFVSRGDKSGTHAAELRYWNAVGLENKGAGYRECGCGMGPALNMAASMGAYVLTDRGTWLSFKNRQDLTVLVEGDQRLFNQYGVMVVNPAKHPHVKVEGAQKFVDWVVSPTGQSTINAYKIGGEQLFFANANK